MPEIHHVEYQGPGTGTAERNAAIIIIINYACVIPAMTSQNVYSEKDPLCRWIKICLLAHI